MIKILLPAIFLLILTTIFLSKTTEIKNQLVGTSMEIIKSDQVIIHKPNSNVVITLVTTGDIIPARYINAQSVAKNNFIWPYEKVADFLKNADISFVNFETPLLKNCPVTSDGMVFCADHRNIEGLNYAGIDIVNLANNHAGNWGKEGISETLRYLKQTNILATGINGPVFKEVKGVKFAFLGYNDIEKRDFLSSADEEKIKNEIKEAKLEADIVVVAFHFGIEYQTQPSKRQKELAHLVINSGADLVIGNHPHWIQPYEYYNGKFIVYAHGNFIFDQFWSKKTLEGIVTKFTFKGIKLQNVEFFPVQLDENGAPYFTVGSEKERILNDLNQASQILIKQP